MTISYYSILLFLLTSLCAVTGSFAQESNPVPPAFAHLFEVEGMMSDSVVFPKGRKAVNFVDNSWSILTRRQTMKLSKAHHLGSFYADSTRTIRVQMMTPPSPEWLAAVEALDKQRKQKEKQLKQLLNEPAPNFEVTSLEGDSFSIESLRGKTIVLNFWFVDCPPCRREIPDLNELVNTYDSEDIVFLAIALDKPDRLKEFLASTPLLYEMIPTGREYAKLYEVRGYPTNIVIDTEGHLSFRSSGVGLRSIAKLEKAIAKSLK